MDEYSLLMQYKELLDDGIITAEEFEKKKREVLFADEIKEEARKNKLYDEAKTLMEIGTSSSYDDALQRLRILGNWKDSEQLLQKCSKDLAEIRHAEEIERLNKERYDRALSNIKRNTVISYKSAIADLEALGDWKDSREVLARAKKECEELVSRLEKEAREKTEAEAAKKEFFKRKTTKAAIAAFSILVIAVIAFFAYIKPQIIIPNQKYNAAVELLENGDDVAAKRIFKELGDYKDSQEQLINCEVVHADNWVKQNTRYIDALKVYRKYSDSPYVTQEKIDTCKENIYQRALQYFNDERYELARTLFGSITDYSDSQEYMGKCTGAIRDRNEALKKKREEAEKKEKEAEAAEVDDDDETASDGATVIG